MVHGVPTSTENAHLSEKSNTLGVMDWWKVVEKKTFSFSVMVSSSSYVALTHVCNMDAQFLGVYHFTASR